MLIRRLKKTSQGHLRKDTAKTTYESVFEISKRQLFCKSYECLSKPLFTQHTHTFENCLGRISGCLATDFCKCQGFQGWFYVIFAILRVFHLHFCYFSGSRLLHLRIRCCFYIRIFLYLIIDSFLFMESQISGSPWKSEKGIFQGF